MFRTLALTGFFVMALTGCGGGGNAAVAEDDGSDHFRNLPTGWTVAASSAVPEQQVTTISQKLGGQIVRLTNTTLSVDGQSIQINTLVCATDEDAIKVRDALLRVHKGNHALCPREGKLVYEFTRTELKVVERAYRDLGFKPPKVIYDVSFQAAPVVKCDAMAWNPMFNAFLVPEPSEARIRELSKRFTFGNQFRLRNHGLGSEPSSFTLVPKSESKPDPSGDLTTYTFGELPTQHGVPQVAVTGVVTTEAYATTPTKRKAGTELLGPTEFWPTMDAEVVALAKQITGRHTDPGDKVAAILAWCASPKNLKYDQRILGSRYGVKTVLKQRYGMCWDFSDCFVTLCRASGVPCRQVLGWLTGVSGHVWAEVLIEGQGWRQVDPTAGLGCDTRYVPFVATEDGAMSYVYTSAVRIVPRAANAQPR